MLGEDSLGHVHVHLGCVALKSYHHQSESSLLPKRTARNWHRNIPWGQHSVRVGYTPTMVIANPDISWLKDREFSKYQVVQGIHLGFFLFLLCWLCLQISPSDCDQVDAEHKAEVGDDGEKTDDE